MLSRLGSIANHSKFKKPTVTVIVNNYKPRNELLITNVQPTRTVNHWYTQCSADGKYIAVSTQTTPRGISVSSDAGVTFTKTLSAVEAYAYICMSTSAQYMYCVCPLKIYRSSDYGSNWTATTVTGSVALNSIICSESGQNVYTIDNANGKIYKSSDYGANYSLFYNYGTSSMINIWLNESENTLYWNSNVTANNHVYRLNMTTNVINVWKPNPSSNNCAWMAVSSNGQYLYAIYPGITNNQLAYSTNYGGTWALKISMQVLQVII